MMKDLPPFTVDDPTPMVCTIADVCRILQIKESQFHALRRQGRFPIPEIEPRLDKRPRFRGIDVRRYVNGGETRRSPIRRSA